MSSHRRPRPARAGQEPAAGADPAAAPPEAQPRPEAETYPSAPGFLRLCTTVLLLGLPALWRRARPRKQAAAGQAAGPPVQIAGRPARRPPR
jgi:hypothetical protein